jgi:hypothetical protein
MIALPGRLANFLRALRPVVLGKEWFSAATDAEPFLPSRLLPLELTADFDFH